MYEAFYGLTEKPFNLTPDPRFLFLSDKHKEAFAHLLYGIKNRTGFIMVSGEVGTGKTTICRSLLNQLDEDIEVAFIFNPFLSPEELLRKINEDFGILSQARTVKELIDELNEYLLDRNAQGKNCVLVIDEAQDLSPTVLEQIRLLSNLETETQKLLQIVLIGQPELALNLQLPELRQLNQRITARYHLRSLDQKETLQYIAYRLSTAGGRGQVRFTRGAIRAVYKASGGTPRVINAICDRALLVGYTKELRDITAGLVREAAREIRGVSLKKRAEILPVLWRYGLPSGTVVLTAAVLMGLVKLIGPFDSRRVVVTQAPLTVPAAPATVTAPVVSAPEVPAPEAAAPEAAAPEAAAKVEKVETKALDAPLVADAVQTAKKGLSEQVAEADAAAVRNAGLARIFAAWNVAVVTGYPEADDAQTLARFAESNGLASEILSPALDQLLAIGFPALVRVKTGNEARWAALIGVEDGRVRLAVGAPDAVEAPRDEFRDIYCNEAIVFWRDRAPRTPVLRQAMKGSEVADLKRSLKELSRLKGPVDSIYDAETARAVARIQAETGLEVDGIAGKQVRMVLNSWMGAADIPSLIPREVVVAEKAADKQSQKPADPEPEAIDAPAKDAVEKVEKKEDFLQFKAPEGFDPGFNALPEMPMRTLPPEEPELGEPETATGAAGEQKAAVIVQELAPPAPLNAPQAPRELPQMPRLPGAPSPLALENVSHELHS